MPSIRTIDCAMDREAVKQSLRGRARQDPDSGNVNFFTPCPYNNDYVKTSLVYPNSFYCSGFKVTSFYEEKRLPLLNVVVGGETRLSRLLPEWDKNISHYSWVQSSSFDRENLFDNREGYLCIHPGQPFYAYLAFSEKTNNEFEIELEGWLLRKVQ